MNARLPLQCRRIRFGSTSNDGRTNAKYYALTSYTVKHHLLLLLFNYLFDTYKEAR